MAERIRAGAVVVAAVESTAAEARGLSLIAGRESSGPRLTARPAVVTSYGRDSVQSDLPGGAPPPGPSGPPGGGPPGPPGGTPGRPGGAPGPPWFPSFFGGSTPNRSDSKNSFSIAAGMPAFFRTDITIAAS